MNTIAHRSPRALCAAALAATSLGAAGQTAELFRDADLAQGEKLIAQHRCNECHARRVGGDGSAIFRPQGRISSPSLLRDKVEYCNTEMNLGMFPEEVIDVAAVLDRDHYHFGAKR